jgi:hypothetical protein
LDAARRKALQEAAKAVKTFYGVVKLTNSASGRVFIGSFSNIKNRESYLRDQLDDGRHPNAALQADWRIYGSAAFSYEVLAEKDAAEVNDAAWEAKQLEAVFLEELQPYGERGYNRPPAN